MDSLFDFSSDWITAYPGLLQIFLRDSHDGIRRFNPFQKMNMKRKTLAQVEEELESMTRERDRLWEKFSELKEEKKERERKDDWERGAVKDQFINQTRNLLEIIRWQINPKTAESPFEATKEQRDEHRRF